MNTPLSFIELSASALEYNFRSFRSLVAPKTAIVAVVKANAYGHGLPEFVSILAEQPDYYQVDDIEELRAIRPLTKQPVLVFGYVAGNDIEEALRLGGQLAVYDESRLDIISNRAQRLGMTAMIHVKIDALLGRQGLLPEALPGFIDKLKQTSNVRVDSVYAHFANIEDTSELSHAQAQLQTYRAGLSAFRQHGFTDFKTHISATSGVLAYEKGSGAHSLARLGIGLYGLWPSEDLRRQNENRLLLKPVLRWVSHVAQVKTVPAGFPIGYGLTHVTSKPTTVAVVPQGYSDGFDRKLSNIGEVLIAKTRCPLLGRVAMNMLVADVSHSLSVRPEDEVVLLGAQGHETISAEAMAEKIGTINYEVVARLSPLLPRLVR